MKSISITENYLNRANIIYIKDNLERDLVGIWKNVELFSYNDRVELKFDFYGEFEGTVKTALLEQLSDIFGIYYKNEYFLPRIQPKGLTETERRILLSAFISADIEEDRRYILGRLKDIENYTLDGFFNFRLIPLKKKWAEIVEYIPSYFDGERLKDFISFILDEKRGKRVYVSGGSVYDGRFVKRERNCLLYGAKDILCEASVLQEVLLSGCGEVEIFGKMDENEEKYLKTFFGNKIIFANGGFSNKNS